ncbi:MAG: hydroxymethylbilane synthase [Syntrophales bacterium]|nr:hydroxymethylbilane synthase [Syntrophales bacterium]
MLRIGTRGSNLALKQAHWVADRLKEKYPDMITEISVIKTKGDRMQNISLANIGGKGVFVKEIEEALLKGDIAIAVHSMKDVPTELPEELEIGVVTEREDPRDVLISRENGKLEDLPTGARIGTGSLRRALQLRNLMPDIKIVSIRGNLDTRIKKLKTDDLDGVVVAAAGMKRMGWAESISQFIPIAVMVPSPGQGALGIELRKDDEEIRDIVSFLNHSSSSIEVMAERAFLTQLGGGCQVPIAAFGKQQDDELILRGLVGSLDGRTIVDDEVRGSSNDWEELGKILAERISSRGGRAILEEIYNI